MAIRGMVVGALLIAVVACERSTAFVQQTAAKAPLRSWTIHDSRDTTEDMSAKTFRASIESMDSINSGGKNGRARFDYSCDDYKRRLWMILPDSLRVESDRVGVRIGSTARFDTAEALWFAVPEARMLAATISVNVDSLVGVWSHDTVAFAYEPRGLRERHIRFDFTSVTPMLSAARRTCGPSLEEPYRKKAATVAHVHGQKYDPGVDTTGDGAVEAFQNKQRDSVTSFERLNRI